MSNDLTVAKTILEQMGGGRLMALTGAHSFVGNENSLQFSLKSGARDGINKVRIELTPMDVYGVSFYRIHGTQVTEISKHEDVYAEDLQNVFEQATGLYTTLMKREE